MKAVISYSCKIATFQKEMTHSEWSVVNPVTNSITHAFKDNYCDNEKLLIENKINTNVIYMNMNLVGQLKNKCLWKITIKFEKNPSGKDVSCSKKETKLAISTYQYHLLILFIQKSSLLISIMVLYIGW